MIGTIKVVLEALVMIMFPTMIRVVVRKTVAIGQTGTEQQDVADVADQQGIAFLKI
jgi:hypothetical protein